MRKMLKISIPAYYVFIPFFLLHSYLAGITGLRFAEKAAAMWVWWLHFVLNIVLCLAFVFDESTGLPRNRVVARVFLPLTIAFLFFLGSATYEIGKTAPSVNALVQAGLLIVAVCVSIWIYVFAKYRTQEPISVRDAVIMPELTARNSSED